MFFRRRRGWPTNIAVERTTVHGPHPIAVTAVAALDRQVGLGLAGRSGSIIAGEPASMHYRFTGYLPGVATTLPPVGSTLNPLRSPRTALPATTGPIGSSGQVLDLLARTSPEARS